MECMFRIQATYIAEADKAKAELTSTMSGVNNLLNAGIEELKV